MDYVPLVWAQRGAGGRSMNEPPGGGRLALPAEPAGVGERRDEPQAHGTCRCGLSISVRGPCSFDRRPKTLRKGYRNVAAQSPRGGGGPGAERDGLYALRYV